MLHNIFLQPSTIFPRDRDSAFCIFPGAGIDTTAAAPFSMVAQLIWYPGKSDLSLNS